MRPIFRHATLALVATGILLAASPAHGQAAGAETWTPEQINKDRVSIVMNSLDLSADEKAALQPIYTEYRTAMGRYDEQISSLLVDFGKNYATLTDAKAGELMDKWLAIEEGRMSNRNDYYGRMREVLPAKKALRLAQMENKLDTILRMDFVRSVPVAR